MRVIAGEDGAAAGIKGQELTGEGNPVGFDGKAVPPGPGLLHAQRIPAEKAKDRLRLGAAVELHQKSQ